jgi:hypothetical protein
MAKSHSDSSEPSSERDFRRIAAIGKKAEGWRAPDLIRF